jgi:hypothetical protein
LTEIKLIHQKSDVVELSTEDDDLNLYIGEDSRQEEMERERER